MKLNDFVLFHLNFYSSDGINFKPKSFNCLEDVSDEKFSDKFHIVAHEDGSNPIWWNHPNSEMIDKSVDPSFMMNVCLGI